MTSSFPTQAAIPCTCLSPSFPRVRRGMVSRSLERPTGRGRGSCRSSCAADRRETMAPGFIPDICGCRTKKRQDCPTTVDRRSYGELLGGLQPKPKSPEEALLSMRVRPGFKVELVASEPLVKDPIAFEWGAGRQALGRGNGRLPARHRWSWPLGRCRPLSRGHGWRRPLRQVDRLYGGRELSDRRDALGQRRAGQRRPGDLLCRGHETATARPIFA